MSRKSNKIDDRSAEERQMFSRKPQRENNDLVLIIISAIIIISVLCVIGAVWLISTLIYVFAPGYTKFHF